MKHFIFGLISSFLFSAIAPAAQVNEGVVVNRSYLNVVRSRPELTVDHLNANSFELYGPTGLKAWLNRNGIPYTEQTLESQRSYPTPEEIGLELQRLAAAYPDITQLVSIGKSVQGRDLWVMKISDHAAQDENEPEFKYIANMHGDEITGREMMLRLIEDLLANYGKDPEITGLIDTTEIYIMPSMNPDGAALRTRGNANGVDLNRDFPDFTTSDNQNQSSGRAVETQAVMRWQATRNFALSANFHGGSEVVNYPWDTTAQPHPLDSLVKGFSLEYARRVPYIYQSSTFIQGITNGYAWYTVDGGMQDWSYYWHNDLQVTIELSNKKWPVYETMDDYYLKNRSALLTYLGLIHTL